MPRPLRPLALAAFVLAAAWPAAQAGMFDDEEARRAILDLRQKFDEVKARSDEQSNQLQQLRRSVLELSSQNDQLRNELATLRGQNEQLARTVAETQRKQTDIAQGVDERVRKLEPQAVSVDGREFKVEPDERRQYEEAIALMRKGDYPGASTALLAFTQRFPSSGYKESALFWLGNARYANRDYKEAMWAFRSLSSQSPDHPKAPEALLSLANCQIELKDRKGARKSLEDLIKAYPSSEAAQAAQERLSTLK